MIVSVVKEIKDKENRVALTPEGAKHLTDKGHTVLIENNAGIDSGFANEEYLDVKAEIVDTKKAWNAELIIKVKEPLEQEYKYLKNQIIFTYLHLSGVPKSLTEALLEKKTAAIAYETIEDKHKKLPLLAPMSAIAGNMAVTMGSYYLAKFSGGSGMQLGTVLGKKYGKVMIVGDGIVGMHAAKTAYGIGAKVYVFGIEKENEEILKKEIGEDINWILSNKENISEHIKDADLVIGAVLFPGAKAPFVISEDMIKSMHPGSVVVDVSIDQGGCIQTSKPTSHSNPIFIKHDVIHYCVTNMPGAYPKTSTIALTEATLPYILKLAEHGIKALKEDKGFVKGLNTHNGFITYESVAKDLSMIDKFRDLNELM